MPEAKKIDAVEGIVKVTMNFRRDSVDKLGKIQRTFRRASKTDANAYAIDLANFLADEISRGGKVRVEEPDGSIRELVIPR